MHPQIFTIAESLKEYFLGVSASTDVTIFLCGGANQTESAFRKLLGNALASLKSKYHYSIFYPEDMFVELVLGHQKHNLLTLENLLAKSVGAVVILLQSPGTFTELGAFSNHSLLKNKLIVVVKPEYRKNQSFINNGPIRHLMKETSSHVLFLAMIEANRDSLVKAISQAARDIATSFPPQRDLTNPIACYAYYLALLYVLDPMPRKAFTLIAKTLERQQAESSIIAAETVANGLVNNGDALLLSQNLSISTKGVNTLFTGVGSTRRIRDLEEIIFDLRIIALNNMLRRKYKNFWGDAA